MPLPHLDRPLCEPVELRPGALVRAERVHQGREAAASDPFPHFHDVHELVLFERVGGYFEAEDRRYPLSPRCAAFIPSMRHHDFEVEAGPRGWILIQIEAVAGEMLARDQGLDRLRHPFCARPDRRLYRRLMMLADWLVELDAADPLCLSLTHLLLRAVVAAPPVAGQKLTTAADALQRLRPAIDHLRRYPAHAPGVERAAILCALSPAYFSRRFKQQVGMSWSDYVRTHRLHLASRRLLETDQGIAAIAYDLGFSTASHFAELFHRRFGMSPKDYRRQGQLRGRRAAAGRRSRASS